MTDQTYSDAWFAEMRKALAGTARRDETALHAKISELEQECARLRMRIEVLEREANARVA